MVCCIKAGVRSSSTTTVSLWVSTLEMNAERGQKYCNTNFKGKIAT